MEGHEPSLVRAAAGRLEGESNAVRLSEGDAERFKSISTEQYIRKEDEATRTCDHRHEAIGKHRIRDAHFERKGLQHGAQSKEQEHEQGIHTRNHLAEHEEHEKEGVSKPSRSRSQRTYPETCQTRTSSIPYALGSRRRGH